MKKEMIEKRSEPGAAVRTVTTGRKLRTPAIVGGLFLFLFWDSAYLHLIHHIFGPAIGGFIGWALFTAGVVSLVVWCKRRMHRHADSRS